MLDKVYLEITNICNLDCSFCHKTARERRLMSDEEFERRAFAWRKRKTVERNLDILYKK